MNDELNALDRNQTPDLTANLTTVAREHYRPEPLTGAEKSLLLSRVDERLRARRALRLPRLALGGVVAAGVACVFTLVLDVGRSPAPQRASLDRVLIPSEAYAADLAGSDFQNGLPADYAAIEMLLLDR